MQTNKILKNILIFTLVFSWLFSGYPHVWKKSNNQYLVKIVKADSTTFTSNGTFTAPTDVCSVIVEAWGGGGGGYQVTGAAGGGGGGAAYTKGTVDVTPSTNYSVTIGTGGGVSTAGGSSSFTGDDSLTVSANGGGAGTSTAGGSGGAAQTITGHITASYAGGNGGVPYARAAPSARGGGGGGGSATATANGGTGGGGASNSPGTGGTGEATGGTGGLNTTNATAGGVPGAGGGGSGSASSAGSGGAGRIILTHVACPVISITISDGTISYGNVTPNTAKTTLSGDLNDMQTVTSSSSIAVDLTIKGQDASGGGCTWTLASTTNTDQYVHQFCNDTANDCTGPPTNYTALTTSYQTFVTGIGATSSVDMQLRLITPTESNCFGQQSVNVTVLASAP